LGERPEVRFKKESEQGTRSQGPVGAKEADTVGKRGEWSQAVYISPRREEKKSGGRGGEGVRANHTRKGNGTAGEEQLCPLFTLAGKWAG